MAHFNDDRFALLRIDGRIAAENAESVLTGDCGRHCTALDIKCFLPINAISISAGACDRHHAALDGDGIAIEAVPTITRVCDRHRAAPDGQTAIVIYTENTIVGILRCGNVQCTALNRDPSGAGGDAHFGASHGQRAAPHGEGFSCADAVPAAGRDRPALHYKIVAVDADVGTVNRERTGAGYGKIWLIWPGVVNTIGILVRDGNGICAFQYKHKPLAVGNARCAAADLRVLEGQGRAIPDDGCLILSALLDGASRVVLA